MMKKLIFVLPLLSCVCMTGARANWEYESEYVAGGWYNDDGSRFVLSVRGGASYGTAKIKNDIGELDAFYYYDSTTLNASPASALKAACNGVICSGYYELGYGNIGELHAKENFKKLTFAAGASVGWIVPYHSNWRLEVGWDRITETDFDTTPLFDGDLVLSDGSYIENVESGSVHSTVSTDVISLMAFYDFFDGMQKPMHELIPYVGFGLGYANSSTELQLSDRYGDLSEDIELRQDFSEDPTSIILKFHKSKTETSNIAGVLAIGASYGISEKMFIDFGARFMYVPKIKWALSNEDDTRHRDWFSAENMFLTNLMLGLRFEF